VLKLFKITGNSLYPFYKDGQRVLCRKVFKNTKIQLNDILIFEKNNHGLVIKRVVSIENNKYFVKGTDAFSVDSRNFGLISHSDVKYKSIKFNLS